MDAIKGLIRSFYGPRAWGDFLSWEDAARRSEGYQHPAILADTYKRTLYACQNGHQIQPHTERIFEHARRSRHVLDFGGAMGLCYFTLRNRLPRLESWSVVELPATIQAARDFEDRRLSFHSSLAGVSQPDLVIANGSLQYCRDPWKTLGQLRSFGVPILIDRIPLLSTQRLTIQQVVNPYRANFPLWFLPEYVSPDEHWLCDESIWLDGKRIPYRGFLIPPARTATIDR